MSLVVNACVSLPNLPASVLLTNPLLDGVELMIIILGTFGQALSGSGFAVNIIGKIHLPNGKYMAHKLHRRFDRLEIHR